MMINYIIILKIEGWVGSDLMLVMMDALGFGVGWKCSKGQQEDEDCTKAYSIGGSER